MENLNLLLEAIKAAPGLASMVILFWVLNKNGLIRFGKNGNGKTKLADVQGLSQKIDRIERAVTETHEWLAREDQDGVKKIYITDSMKASFAEQLELNKKQVDLLERILSKK